LRVGLPRGYEPRSVSARPPPLPEDSEVDVGAYTRQARTYEPSDPELRRKRVRPLRLTELERVPAEHRDLHRAMLHLLPEAAFEPGILAELRQTVHRYTEIELDLWLHSMRVLRRTELRSMIPGTTFLAVIGLPPLGEKVLVELDLRFVYRAVDRLLGGHGVAIDIHRPLTEIEQGVFSYLLLKVLLHFQGQFTHAEQVAIRLEDMRNELKSVADIVRHHDQWMCVSWKMNFDLDVGYVRALLPMALAHRIVPARAPEGTALAERIRQRVRRRMGRLQGVSTEGVVELGRIELSQADLTALDPGDIILIDEHTARLARGEVSGQARMLIGLGKRGLVHGELVATPRGDRRELVFQVTNIEIRELPDDHDPHLVHGAHGNPEEVVAAYEDHGAYDADESDDGASDALDAYDEDHGLDDEDEGDDEDGYGDDGYGQDGYAEDGNQEYAEDGAGGEDNLAEAEPLLGDIPMSVVVELGRVRLTADEVIRLRQGQLIELGRSPSDPVDLVVAGRLLAKGELVEIDGALGVKILGLVKEGE
jgi:type III secretion system YscQ/HrcQ family protein